MARSGARDSAGKSRLMAANVKTIDFLLEVELPHHLNLVRLVAS